MNLMSKDLEKLKNDLGIDEWLEICKEDKNCNGAYISISQYIYKLESQIEDLTADKEHLEEELKDLRQDLEDNYRPIPISEQVGISDRDFI